MSPVSPAWLAPPRIKSLSYGITKPSRDRQVFSRKSDFMSGCGTIVAVLSRIPCLKQSPASIGG